MKLNHPDLRRFVAPIGLSCVVTVVLGCSAVPSVATRPPQAAGASPATISSPAAPLPVGATVEACSMLNDAEIEAITDRSVASKTAGSVMGIFDNGCAWELQEGPDDGIAWTIDLGVVSPGGRHYYDTFMAIDGEALPGLGDAAVSDDAGGITAVKGDTMVSVFMIAVMVDEQQMTRELTVAALSHVP